MTGPTGRQLGAGYSGTPLPRKLGVGPDSRVLVLHGPAGFDPGAEWADRADLPGAPFDVVIAFCADRATLESEFSRAAAAHTSAGALWICWPKLAARRTHGIVSDLTENMVRDWGLTHGRVDVKVAAIDQVWSALKFVIRLADRWA